MAGLFSKPKAPAPYKAPPPTINRQVANPIRTGHQLQGVYEQQQRNLIAQGGIAGARRAVAPYGDNAILTG